MAKTCKICGKRAYSDYCMQHKPRKPIVSLPKTPKPKKAVVKKPKAKTRSYYVKQLDKVFSEYIRLSYADKDGYVTCYTCDARMKWRDSQNGHFYSRGRQNTRWLPENCRVQDYRCNVALSGNYIVYTRRLLAEIGEQKLDEMELLSKSTNKISTNEIKEMIDFYRGAVKNLE